MKLPIRTLLAVASVGVLAASGTATAAPKPKPVCNLVEDAKGDTFAVRAQDPQKVYGPQEDAFDLVSQDVAGDGKTLTGVFRVAKLAMTAGTAPGGLDYKIQFVVPGQNPTKENFILNARTDRAGAPSYLLALRTVVAQGQAISTKIAEATGTFDMAKSEVRIHVPIDAVKSTTSTLAKGAELTLKGLDQTSSRSTVVNPVTGTATAAFADVAATEKSYKLGTPSCVIPGK